MNAPFKPPTPEVAWPGFRFPEDCSVGELYSLGKEKPCGDWAMEDFWGQSREQVHCQLPRDHEEERGLPHIDFDRSKAWGHGWITDVWYREVLTTKGETK